MLKGEKCSEEKQSRMKGIGNDRNEVIFYKHGQESDYIM